MNWGSVLIILAGLFSIVGAVQDWNWFMNSGRARLFVSLFGRNGARIFYTVLGIVIITAGIISMGR